LPRQALLDYLDEIMQPARLRDYCPNGLQVEGRPTIRRLVTGVTACQALLDAAVARQADAVLVHHGYFWRGEDGRITGLRKQRLGTLLRHEINLFAYHLPLDVHPELGNNAQLALACGWQPEGRFGEQDIGWLGSAGGESLGQLAQRLATVTGRTPQVFGDLGRPIHRVAWCTGGAQDYFEAAIALGVDLYVSGEVSEPTFHLAHESGVAYLAAGHHASERFGVRALGEHLAQRFGLEVEFVDIENPV
jgi:dinuclear metal center YbgI/SA1388 family protein